LLLEKARIVCIIDLPLETFLQILEQNFSINSSKLSKNKIPDDYPIFMAVADYCGHDSVVRKLKKMMLLILQKNLKNGRLRTILNIRE
jgi:hypothetical protein